MDRWGHKYLLRYVDSRPGRSFQPSWLRGPDCNPARVDVARVAHSFQEDDRTRPGTTSSRRAKSMRRAVSRTYYGRAFGAIASTRPSEGSMPSADKPLQAYRAS